MMEMRAWLALLLPAVLLVGGCDPCSGVASCETGARISYMGTMVVNATGAPVSGVQVELHRAAGVGLPGGPIVVTTGEDGRFHLAGLASEPGELLAYVVVRPPAPYPPYVIEEVALQTTERIGDGRFFPVSWVVDPYLDYAVELYVRGQGTPPPTSLVEFRRTGGIAVDPDTFTLYSNGIDGRFPLRPHPLEAGVLVGDLVILTPGLSEPSVIRDVELRTSYERGQARFAGKFGVGPSLEYVGELQYRHTGEPAAGVTVEFRRTGGIPATPEAFTAVTGSTGRFPVSLRTTSFGEVIGELTVRPPAPHPPFTIPEVRIGTFDADGGRLLGVWGVGLHLPYAARLLWAETGEPAVGVEVEVRWTGGVGVQPERFRARTNHDGDVAIAPVPAEEGEAVFEIHVLGPDGEDVLVVPEVRVATTQLDLPSQLVGTWEIPSR